MSSSYKPIATVDAGNGYQADLHEFQITPQGSAFLTAYSLVSADLSSAGGRRDGILQDAILQEVDIPTGLVMFEWHAYGHVALWDSYCPRAVLHQPRPSTSSTSTRSRSTRGATATSSSPRATPGRRTRSTTSPAGSCGASAGASRASRWAPGTGTGLPARRPLAARPHAHDLRQRRRAEGALGIARAARADRLRPQRRSRWSAAGAARSSPAARATPRCCPAAAPSSAGAKSRT